MSELSSLRKKILDIYKKYSDLVASSDESNINKIGEYLHPDITGFGTTISEKYKGRESVLRFYLKQFKQCPEGYSYKIKKLDFQQLNENTVQLIVVKSIEIRGLRGSIFVDIMRISITMIKDNNKWLFRSIHSSIPDSAANESELFAGANEPKFYKKSSVMFTDFVGFTSLTTTFNPSQLVTELNNIFSRFDDIIHNHGLIKIKTIGDAYMVASGLKNKKPSNEKDLIMAAKELLNYLHEKNKESSIKWKMRVGIHSGPVVGGVIGRDNLIFDIWGDTVNLANAVETASEPNRINISADTYSRIKDSFLCEDRGDIEIKDKRMIHMYFVK